MLAVWFPGDPSNLIPLFHQAYLAARIESCEAGTCISTAIHYVQIMRLNKSSSIETLCTTLADRQQTKRAVWFLYALEKEVCLRAETFPVCLIPHLVFSFLKLVLVLSSTIDVQTY